MPATCAHARNGAPTPLVELCRVGAHDHASGPGRRHRPHVSVVLDHRSALENGAGTAPRRAHAEHVGRLPVATIERMLCDAGIARVITRGRSVPIDVGRTTRTIPPALWRALVVRDRGCVAPGCDRPVGWCEVHHRIPWSHGGATDPANCELRSRAITTRCTRVDTTRRRPDVERRERQLVCLLSAWSAIAFMIAFAARFDELAAAAR